MSKSPQIRKICTIQKVYSYPTKIPEYQSQCLFLLIMHFSLQIIKKLSFFNLMINNSTYLAIISSNAIEEVLRIGFNTNNAILSTQRY